MSDSFDPDVLAFMQLALQEAELARCESEVAVGCVIVDSRTGEVIGRGRNATNASKNATRHAEFMAVDEILGRGLGEAVFQHCDLYVTVEPCIMCAAAMGQLGIRRVFYGCGNDKFGGCGSVCSFHNSTHYPLDPSYVGFPCTRGILEAEAVEVLRRFYLQGNPKAPKPQRPVVPPVAALGGGGGGASASAGASGADAPDPSSGVDAGVGAGASATGSPSAPGDAPGDALGDAAPQAQEGPVLKRPRRESDPGA